MNIFVLTNTQKTFFKTGVVFCLALVLLAVPVLALAQGPLPGDPDFVGPVQRGGLVPCDGPSLDKPGLVSPPGYVPCDFKALLNGINGIINWLFIIAIPVSLVAFTYAGILFMSGKEGNITEGKEIFLKVVQGIAIMAVGWLLVHTIIRALLNPKADLGAYLFGL